MLTARKNKSYCKKLALIHAQRESGRVNSSVDTVEFDSRDDSGLLIFFTLIHYIRCCLKKREEKHINNVCAYSSTPAASSVHRSWGDGGGRDSNV